MRKLQIKDKKIIYELDRNSRQSNREIAKKLRLSQDVVNYRIRKLIQQGYIKKFITAIDFNKLGYIGFRAYLKLENTSPNIDKEIFEYLGKDTNITYLAEIEGTYNIAFALFTEHPKQFYDNYYKFKEKYKEYISKDKITIYNKIHQYGRKYLNEGNSKCENNKEIKSEPDKTELKLLKELATNSRISLTELSEKTGKPISTIAYKIKKLKEAKIIQYFGIVFDFEKIGRSYIRVDIVVRKTQTLNSIKEYAKQHPDIIYYMETIGGADIELIFESESTEDCYEIMKDMRSKINGIKDWELVLTRKQHKYQYFPDPQDL